MDAITNIRLSVTATTVVCPQTCKVTHISLNPGSGASTVLLYDSATTTTGVAIKIDAVGPANAATVPVLLTYPVFFANGVTAVVTGTGATANIGFTRG